ncbi:ABC transporter permease [Clostridia bacterium]|nr:ABC transporter permease [Clostridia bacterium]
MDRIIEIISLPFFTRAVFTGVFIAVSAALLGVVLVLKHYALIGHGLADVGFASTSAAAALGISPTLITTPVVILASAGIMAYSRKKGSSGDTVLGIVASAAIAAGVIITAATKGFNVDVYNYMFGSILAIGISDAVFSVALAAAVIIVFCLFYNRIFAVTADETFAEASGINVAAYELMIAVLTGLVVITGMKMMGTLLISSLVILPAESAKRVSVSFRGMVIASAVISVIGFLGGLILSAVVNLPAGAGIVAVNVAILAALSVWSKLRPAGKYEI